MKPPGVLVAVVTDGYLVEIKPSARRTNAAVGRTVNRGGTRHEFPDRDAAEEWAAALSDADPVVWVRTANPGDDSVDAYLMGRRRPPTDAGGDGDEDTTPPGRQAGVDAY